MSGLLDRFARPFFKGAVVVSDKKVEKDRDGFRPREVVNFVRELGEKCWWGKEERGIDWIKKKAGLLAYRKAVFQKFDDANHVEALLQDAKQLPSKDSVENLEQPAEVVAQDNRQHSSQNSVEVLDRPTEMFSQEREKLLALCEPGSMPDTSSEEIDGTAWASEDIMRLNWDENTGNLLEKDEPEGTRDPKLGFQLGDLVWGKVNSHMWWPGHIINESLASPSVLFAKRDGNVLVALFADGSYRWFDLAEIVSFQPHYAEKSQQTSSRKFIKAVDEALKEVGRRSALGLTCCCQNSANFRHSSVSGCHTVDLGGDNGNGVYSVDQIKKARDEFKPAEVLSFVQQMASTPLSSERKSINSIKNKVIALSYRKAVFEDLDSSLLEAFETEPIHPSPKSVGVLDQLPDVSSKVVESVEMTSCIPSISPKIDSIETEGQANDSEEPTVDAVTAVELEKMTSCEPNISLNTNSRETKGQANVSEETMIDVVTVVESENVTSCKPSSSLNNNSRETEGKSKVLEEPAKDVTLNFESIHSAVYEQSTADAVTSSKYEFKLGDLVWGKGESSLWWPGKISDESFAPPAVLRAKTKGHMLVALFGGSTYGWFDLVDLIPFVPYYTEKSRQTNSEHFMKAVEEAINEASRESALGLACCCRNRFNFRNSIILGYFAVDVDGYECGGVFSEKQIKKARDAFQPIELLSFVQRLALNPSNSEQGSIDGIMNKSIALAYRKAVFEEHDETYDQAFDKLEDPSPDSTILLDQLAEVPVQAPSIGPLVVAEFLGDSRSSAETTKLQDQVQNVPRCNQVTGDNVDFNCPPVFTEELAAGPHGHHLSKKRCENLPIKPQVPDKEEGAATTFLNHVGPERGIENVDNLSVDISSAGSAIGFPACQPLTNGSTSAMLRCPEDKNTSVVKELGIFQEIKERRMIGSGLDESDVLREPESSKIDSIDQKIQEEIDEMVDKKHEGFLPLEDCSELDLVENGSCRNISISESISPLTLDAKLRGEVTRVGIDGLAKKRQGLKCPGEDFTHEASINPDEKKRKSEGSLNASLDRRRKCQKRANESESVARKSVGLGLVPEVDLQMESERNDSMARSISPSTDSAAMHPKVKTIKSNLSLLVSNLLDLAIDPFHGVERNIPKVVRQAFLRYRSVVYKKSLAKPLPRIPESSELLVNRSTANTVVSETPVNAKDVLSSSELLQHRARPDDSTKAGRKRSSDRQEEISEEKVKKLKMLKSMVGQKKPFDQKIPEVQRGKNDMGTKPETLKKPEPEVQQGGQRERGMPILPKSDTVVKPEQEVQQGGQKDMSMPIVPKSNSVKRPEPLGKVDEPIMLVMMFPPRTTLPSAAELKERFERFGPLDHSFLRILSSTSTCRIVFKNKSHGQAAYNHAVRNSTLFGNVKVNYQLWNLKSRAPEAVEPTKKSGRSNASAVDMGLKTPQQPLKQKGLHQQPPKQKTLAQEPLKQIVEPKTGKPCGGEAKSILDLPGESPPLKDMLGGNEKTVEPKSCIKRPSSGDANPIIGVQGESPRVKFMLGESDSSSKGEQVMVVSSRTGNRGPEVCASPASVTIDDNRKNSEKVNTASPLSHALDTARDFSNQMLTLMLKCNEIVTTCKVKLGHNTYTPL